MFSKLSSSETCPHSIKHSLPELFESGTKVDTDIQYAAFFVKRAQNQCGSLVELARTGTITLFWETICYGILDRPFSESTWKRCCRTRNRSEHGSDCRTEQWLEWFYFTGNRWDTEKDSHSGRSFLSVTSPTAWSILLNWLVPGWRSSLAGPTSSRKGTTTMATTIHLATDGFAPEVAFAVQGSPQKRNKAFRGLVCYGCPIIRVKCRRARVSVSVCVCAVVCVCVCVCVAYDAPSESQAQLDPHAVGLTDERVQSLSMTVSRISSSGNLDRGFNWTAERDRFCSDAGTKPADASSLFNTDARRRWCFIQNLAARSRTVPIYLPKTWRSIFFAVVIERTPASLFDRPTVASSLWNLSSSNAGVDIGCPGDIWFKDLMG